MSIRKYEIFDAAVQYGNFAKAAVYLNLTPSAVSHAINDLEEEIDLKLFSRNKKGVVLTAEGRRLLPFIRNIQKAEQVFGQEVDQIHGLQTGTVLLCAPGNICTKWLPGLITAFRQRHQNIGIKIVEGNHREIISWIEEDRADIAFLTGEAPTNFIKLASLEDSLICVAPAYDTLQKPTVSIEDLRKMNILVNSVDENPEVPDFLNRNHIKYDSRFSVDRPDALVSLVEANFGACILPSISEFSKDLKVRKYAIEEEDKYPITIVVNIQFKSAPATAAMSRFILEYIEEGKLKL